jgi:hypothetical protein
VEVDPAPLGASPVPMPGWKTLRLAVLTLGIPALAGAQSAEQGSDSDCAPQARDIDRRGTLGVEVWAGIAHNSPRLGFLGAIPDLDLTLGAVRFTRRIHATPRVALDYTLDAIPLAILSRPKQTGPRIKVVCRVAQKCASIEDDVLISGKARAVGISPVGLTAVLRPSRTVEVAVGGSGGVLWFDRKVPTKGASRFNFTGTAEASVGLVDEQGRGPFVTYRFHHLSNGGTSVENPAVASNLLSLGLRWRLAAAHASG